MPSKFGELSQVPDFGNSLYIRGKGRGNAVVAHNRRESVNGIMRRIAKMRAYLFDPLREPSLVRLEAELLGVRGCNGRGTS